MNQDEPSVEELLARLAAATDELSGPEGQPERVWELVKERGWIARELVERAAKGPLGEGDLERLGQVIRSGEQVRQSFVVRRETAREQVRELRAARRTQNEFKPYRMTSGGHVAVDL
jgi:hypothetical protein